MKYPVAALAGSFFVCATMSAQASTHHRHFHHHHLHHHHGVYHSARSGGGLASVYGYGGARTASGERARPGGFTAAHRSLPFGTHVRVTNKRNGRSVVVRINDRGPFVRGRVIDVTPAAAHALGFSGLAPVALAVLN